MSRMVWISITLLRDIEPLPLIEALQEVSWSLNCEGDIVSLPLGDKGKYDWQHIVYSQESAAEVLQIMERKFQLEEEIGVTMVWSDSDIGINISLKQNLFEFSYSASRKKLNIEGMTITDVNWYLEHTLIAKIFRENPPEKIEFTQM